MSQHLPKCFVMAVGIGLGLAALTAAPAATAGGLTRQTTSAKPPAVKGGKLKRCYSPLQPTAPLPRRPGEKLVYDLELLGVTVGAVHLETTRRGRFNGSPVTEYRGWLEPEDLVQTVVKIEGRLASIIPDGSFTPIRSMTRYRFRDQRVHEKQTRGQGGTRVWSEAQIDGKQSTKNKAYAVPTHDFMSGILLLRRLPAAVAGCAVVYSHQRVYTAWIQPEGLEKLETSRGEIGMERYSVRYGSNKTKKIRTIQVWFWPGKDRVVYQVKGLTKLSPVARLASYRRGRD